MVRLTKIYTRTGDDGTTGLVGGARVLKSDPRVVAYGEVDEANAAIGAAIASVPASDALGIASLLRGVQNDLFDAGADLATPVKPGEKPGEALRVTPAQTARLEPVIDLYNDRLKPLTSFVLPGGSVLASALHVARTVVRRAERAGVELLRLEPQQSHAEPVRYLNRLSDLLFVLARVANDDGRADVLWVPGANRNT
jgi:cob(I)alamin adenosyltransferase